jgi:integrase
MSNPLTALKIERLKPRADRYEIADGGQRGLKLVVFPSGAKSFVVRYRFGGRKKKLTLGQIPLAAARKAAAAALYEVHEGRDPAAAKQVTKAKAADASADTVAAICRQHLAREGAKMRTLETRTYTLDRLVFPAIGGLPIGELRRSHIVRMLDKIQDERGDRTADLALSYLRAALSWHAARVDDFNSPIVRGMGRYDNAARARSRVLNDDEVRALWKATEPNGTGCRPFHAITRFLLLTGARRDEARLLTWDEIDGDKWVLPSDRNKTKQELVRPLSKAATAIVEAQPNIDGVPFVFTNGCRPLAPTALKIEIDNRSGIRDWRLHDLRRTARTLLSRAGISADIAERCLGHAVGNAVQQIYDRHHYFDEMHRAFEALAQQIEHIVNPDDNILPMRRNG